MNTGRFAGVRRPLSNIPSASCRCQTSRRCQMSHPIGARRPVGVRRLVGVRCLVPSTSDVSSHQEGKPSFPSPPRGYETSWPLRHVAGGHWDGFVGADGGDVARSEDGCVEPSGRLDDATWRDLGTSRWSCLHLDHRGYYIYRVVHIQFSSLHYFAVEILPA